MAHPSTKIEKINLGYRPRRWQAEAQTKLKGKKYGVFICSRQIGKTVAAIAILCSRALQSPPNSACCYIAPTQSQARRIAWLGFKERLRPLGNRVTFSETQLVITLPGDRKIYVLGAESGDNIRGSSFHSVVCDERDSISDEFWREVMLPTTAAWQGKSFILFIGTLAGGQSSLWQLYTRHREDPDWATILMPASKSGCFTDEWLESRRIEMGDGPFMREHECDPRAPVEHAVLGREVQQAVTDGRVCRLPYRHGVEVHTCWDLGVRDFTTVWGFMVVGRWIEVLFYREYAGLGMIDVVGRLKDEFKHYHWGEAILPHDAKNRDKLTAVSIVDAMWDHWPGAVDVQQSAPSPTATLQATRVNMSRCMFDEVECDTGLIRLKSARYVVHPKTGTVMDSILHDDNSHCIDAFRLGMYRVEALNPASTSDVHWDKDDTTQLPSRYFE